MTDTPPCTLLNHLTIASGNTADYEQLARFHYRSASAGPIRHIYKLVDLHPWRFLAAGVVGVIVYASPPANLAARNRVTGGMFSGLDRSAQLTLLNERMLCIRRVIIEPRYRGLGLASYLVRRTLERTHAAMVEAISVMGRVQPFFERAGMTAYRPEPDAKAERMKAALEAAGLSETASCGRVHAAIDGLGRDERGFLLDEMERFCQKFTNRRTALHSPERTEFILSQLAETPVYYLWENPRSPANF